MEFKQEYKDKLLSYLKEGNDLRPSQYGGNTFFWKDNAITLHINRRGTIIGEFRINTKTITHAIEGFNHIELIASQEEDVIQMGIDILIEDIEKERVKLLM